MDIELQRTHFNPEWTLGILSIDGVFQCYTCEDTVRPDGVKVYGKTAIPAGRFEVIVNFSERFQRPMPLLLNVPNFAGVRIHSGNTAKDTEGCILVGNTRDTGKGEIGLSRAAYGPLFDRMVAATQTEKVFIAVH